MDLFSPLGKVHCNFFLAFSIFMFAMFVATAALAIFGQRKNFIVLTYALIGPLLAYYVYRIFYSMCTASLY